MYQQQPGTPNQAQGYQQYPQQGYPPQQQPQYQQPAYQQPSPQPQQAPQPAPQPVQQVPQGPQKDTIVAEEFKKFITSVTWMVADHQQTPGKHIIKLNPPAGKKIQKGDVKKATITITSVPAQTPPQPGQMPTANSIQVAIDTEEKKGFFGSEKKNFPLWMNADEEVDANMQATIGLSDKVRNICTQAKIILPVVVTPPAPAPQPPAPAPQQPAPQQQQYQQPAPQQQQYQQPAPQQQQYQQPAPQQQYQQPQQKVCPYCHTPNTANVMQCGRCGQRI